VPVSRQPSVAELEFLTYLRQRDGYEVVSGEIGYALLCGKIARCYNCWVSS
jgi:hypothetical protein